MTADFDTIIALDVIEDWITLELTVAVVFFGLFFLLVESFDSVVFGVLEALKVLTSPHGNGPSIVDHTELICACTQLLDFLVEHALFIKFKERLPVEWF